GRVWVVAVPAPVGARRKIDKKMVEANAVLIKVLPDAEPDVFALRDAFRVFHRLSQCSGIERWEIPAASSKRVVFENQQWVICFLGPGGAECNGSRLALTFRTGFVDRAAAP